MLPAPAGSRARGKNAACAMRPDLEREARLRVDSDREVRSAAVLVIEPVLPISRGHEVRVAGTYTQLHEDRNHVDHCAP